MMRIRIAYYLPWLLLACVISSCDSNETVKLEVEKDGVPMAGVTVYYSELDNKLGSGDYSGVTDSSGSVEFRVSRSRTPVMYGVTVEGENGGEDIAGGGFYGGSRRATWVEDGYGATFDD